LTGLLTKRFIKVEQQKGVGAEGFQRAEFLRERINEGRHPLGRDDGVGVLVERDNHAGSFVLSCVAQGLADDLLMSQVNAIEKADGQANLSIFRLELRRAMDDAHRRPAQATASFKNGITCFSNSRAVSLSTCSSGMACCTSNFPETAR